MPDFTLAVPGASVDLLLTDDGLNALRPLTPAADRLPYFTGADAAALAVITAAGRALLDDADAAAQRTTLGLGTIATQAANSVTITGGAISGITDLAVADGGTGASTAADARTNLELGDVAVMDEADDAAARAGTASRPISADVAYSAMAPVTLADGATITPDLDAGRVFTVTLEGNRTLANPTNQTPGQSGLIIVSQDATGSRTLAYGTAWDFPGGAPTLSTAANAKDVISYYVQASGTILCTIAKAFS